ncbi:uncharacterized protein [Haliotis asinina]|uniref:uncharacterized protein n=1 Tax=Haliotis asinina TaxID=109174 RepID=UPI0035326CF2
MERATDRLQGLSERCAATPYIADWNAIDTLVFREIHETGTLTLGDSYAVVDIQVDSNALTLSDPGTFTEQMAIVTLTWDSSTYTSPRSTLVIHLKERDSFVVPRIVGALCEEHFRKLQQFAVMMFEDYKTKILTLKPSPLSFELLHVDIPSVQRLKDSINVVSKNFRNLVFEEVQVDVTFELRENDLAISEEFAVGEQQPEAGGYGNRPFAQFTSGKIPARLRGVRGITDYSRVRDESSTKTYEQIARKLKWHQENVDARFEEQRRQNESMRTSLNTILESLNMSRRLGDPHSGEPGVVGHCSGSFPPLSRVSGDAEEATGELPRTGNTTQLHAFAAGDALNVTSGQREERTVANDYDKNRHEQRSKSTCGPTNHEKMGSEITHSDSTIRPCTKSEDHPTITETPVNANPRSTTRKAASYYEAGVRNRFPVPSSAPNTKPEQDTPWSREVKASGKTMSDRYDSATEGYMVPFIHIDGDDPRAKRINATIRRELNSKQTFPPRASASLGTVLCFDTSTSIGDQALRQMKKQAFHFIDGIEDIVQAHDLEENVGVVAFGGISRIEHHLSNDYTSVRDAIEKLELSGRSPLYEALILCLCCLQREGGILSLSGVVALRPRLIIFTDGNASDESDTGTDVNHTDVQVKMRIIALFQSLTTSSIFPNPVVWVPVGNADRDFMMFLAKKSNGFCLEGADITQLCTYQRIQRTIIEVYQCLTNGSETNAMPNQMQKLIGAFGGELSNEDQREISKSVTELIEKGASLPELDRHVELTGLPHLGSRVTRWKDRMWTNYDMEGPGTIVSHIQAKKDWVRVHWDNGQRSECRYGAQGVFDVIVVTDQPRYNSSDMTFDIGCEVTRGPDWEHGCQDGGDGGVGVVIENNDEGLVTVRWLTTAHIDVYRCGHEGKIDLTLRDPVESLKDATQADGQTCHGLAAEADIRKLLDDAALEMDEENYRWVWQWQDGEGRWRLYSDEENQKIEKVFQRPNGSSCLLERNGKSYRVLFKDKHEKCINDDTRRKVKRTRMNEDDLMVYKEVERQLRRS